MFFNDKSPQTLKKKLPTLATRSWKAVPAHNAAKALSNRDVSSIEDDLTQSINRVPLHLIICQHTQKHMSPNAIIMARPTPTEWHALACRNSFVNSALCIHDPILLHHFPSRCRQRSAFDLLPHCRPMRHINPSGYSSSTLVSGKGRSDNQSLPLDCGCLFPL